LLAELLLTEEARVERLRERLKRHRHDRDPLTVEELEIGFFPASGRYDPREVTRIMAMPGRIPGRSCQRIRVHCERLSGGSRLSRRRWPRLARRLRRGSDIEGRRPRERCRSAIPPAKAPRLRPEGRATLLTQAVSPGGWSACRTGRDPGL
jgi:hypothetical protein